VLLEAIDGKTVRTFAFPCGEFMIQDSSYYLGLGLEAHSELLHYLKDYSDSICVAPMVDVATYIRAHQKGS